ncbi:EAL domain-containing protein [Pseudomonas sp. dw_358]|uniref:EAL domain-containing protein n=1 Tax=Pseudomonas sp. dw_358 TaxID=2720083 RepID=UPI001BD2541A|nr:EAL domain-containing protein [Pseudomonas sp. dw_358]
MTCTLLQFRRLAHRPWVLALLAALLSAALLTAASVALIIHQNRAAESAQMNASGERFLLRLEQVFGQLRLGMRELESQPIRDCSAAMLALLQRVGVDHRFIFETSFNDGVQGCSNRPGHPLPDFKRPPDLSGTTYGYWLNTSSEPDDNLAALLMGRGPFRVSTSRGHLADVADLPKGASLLVIVDNGRRAVPVLGPAQPWPPTPDWPVAPGNALTTQGDRLIYRMDTHVPDYQLVMITPRPAPFLKNDTTLWLLLPISLVLALMIGWMTLMQVRRRRSLEGELQGALRRNELLVLYQPIINLHSRVCVGAEALVRWRRSDGSLTSPDLFIPLAESSGQIEQITDFVLARLLDQLGPLLRANPKLYVSVNLAACDVTRPRIGAVVARLLLQHRVAASQIAFEVTERGLVDVAVARETLQALRKVGHRILIDDFGTGYSSLAYLQTLPVDCLKIDKAFIDALGHDAASSGVAPHIIRMAHALHLRVIAEGVELETQADLLTSEGVAFGQGWLFARAVDALHFSEMVTGGRRIMARRGADQP